MKKLVPFLLFQCGFALSAASQNVILIITDDQGYGDISAHGNKIVQTPNLDNLHSESIRLTNFHVNPISAPTRAALMTGKYSTRVGVRGTYATLNYLSSNEKTMGDIFSSMGYRTALFGKWHLGGNYPLRPMDRGFQEWVGHGDGGGGTTNDYWDNVKWDDHYLHNGKWEPYKGFMTDIFFDQAMNYIKSEDNRPFFIYLPTNIPHQSWNTPKEWTEKYTSQGETLLNALFYASVERMDYNVGRLREFLEENGLSENTIIIFMTDNGTANGSSYNAEMRGRKGSLYEGGHRVPCFIHWPDRWGKTGRDINNLTAHIDILPTLINLCDNQPDIETPTFDGKDITPLLDNRSASWNERTIVVDKQQSRMVANKNSQHAVMTDRWRLVNGKELYDIKNDPSQKNNIADNHPSVVNELKEQYDKWWSDVSKTSQDFGYIVAGSKFQDTLFLSGLDWKIGGGDITWSHGYTRKAFEANGEHVIKIETPGVYQFALMRWPKESGYALRDSVPPITGKPIVLSDSYNWQAEPGAKLDIKGAKISINGKVQTFDKITDSTKEVVFQEYLIPGITKLQTWFQVDGMDNLGAYYLYIYKK